MLKAILLAMVMVMALPIGNSRDALATMLDLTQFQWKTRLLFIFAPNHNHPFFDSLHKSLLAQKSEVADRDLVIFEILESGPSSLNTKDLDCQTAQSLRKKFDILKGRFVVILVGKDGGIKLNRQDLTQLEDVFALIDAMPMRQEEMRQKRRIGEAGAAVTNEQGGVE
jgi:hypothetical protein